MQVQPILLATFQFTIYGLLLRGLHRDRLWSDYRWFAILIAWSVAADVSRWILLLKGGIGSTAYVQFYSVALFVSQLLTIILLTEVYALVKSRSDTGHWIVLFAFAGLMTWYLATRHPTEFFLLQRWQLAALQFEILFALLTVTHVYWNHRVRLGANHWALLGGLVLRIALDYLLLTALTLGLVSYASLKPWIQPLALVPWIIWAFGFQRHSPPVRMGTWDAERLHSNQIDFRKAVRGLLRKS